jgi:hypothetical protein
LALLMGWAASYVSPLFVAGRQYHFQSIEGVLRIDTRSSNAFLRRAKLQRLQAIEQYKGLLEQTGPDRPAPLPAWMAQQIASWPAATVPARWSVRYAVLVAPVSGLVVSCLLLEMAMRRRRMRLSRDGVCPGCGYDLRATPSRCPECGMGIEPASAELAH